MRHAAINQAWTPLAWAPLAWNPLAWPSSPCKDAWPLASVWVGVGNAARPGTSAGAARSKLLATPSAPSTPPRSHPSTTTPQHAPSLPPLLTATLGLELRVVVVHYGIQLCHRRLPCLDLLARHVQLHVRKVAHDLRELRRPLALEAAGTRVGRG